METETEVAALTGYAAINNSWGCDPKTLRKLSGKEALKACRLLLAEGFRAYGKPEQARRKRKFRLTSGRNHTWPHNTVWVKGKSVQVWNVNPDEYGLGLAEIIHSVSHWVHNVVNPGLARMRGGGHNGHAQIEQYLIDYAIKKRWHVDGFKVREAQVKAPVDLKAQRYAKVLLRIKWWESRAKRAQTALKKLRQAKARYERVLN